MAAAYIHGIQRQGIYACPKYFAVCSQESGKTSVDAILDERTLRELYLTGFEIAVKEGKPKAIMTAPNRVNGIQISDNVHLLKELLRNEWEFEGIIMTDQSGSRDPVQSLLAGTDLEMASPGFDSAGKIVTAVKNGRLPEEIVNESADRILDAAMTLTENTALSGEADIREHNELARKAAAESAVLLKNENDLLPLHSETRVAVIGDLAFDPRYQGERERKVNPSQLETLTEKIREYNFIVTGISRGYLRNGNEDIILEKEAEELAAAADVVLYCFGLPEWSESEGRDREQMRLPQNQIHLLEKLSRVNPNVVGILNTGSPVEMPWLSCIKSLIYAGLNGQAGAGAILDLINGNINPSGKLSMTWPLRYEDVPSYHYFPGKNHNAQYRESIFVGYRYYDTVHQNVLFPFGYGLSYTRFEYRDIWTEDKGAGFTLTNTGNVDGAEIVQMYVGLGHSKIFRPEKELKGFRKVFLKAGESRTLWFQFDDKTFRYWNARTNRWEVEGGTYRIMIGADSADIRLTAEKEIQGTTEEFPYDRNRIPSYYTGMVSNIQEEEFKALTGKTIPYDGYGNDLTLDDTPAQMYYAKSSIARFIWKRLSRKIKKKEASGRPDVKRRRIMDTSFHALTKQTDGRISDEMMEGILLMINGHLSKGLGRTSNVH
ncbi:MAG TPA: glycoside hydrolase family 3 C-terminal domain-containing protein [Candidatus Mediterraneibacter norfolkensis]|nr:glycoside hydrolase family 3 C-terminal domain-containing protein [Candidatus Mediterraneibacter norfolkensis]